MEYNFDEIINRRDSFSIKWNGGEKSGMDVREGSISLYTADMDFRCAQPIIDAISEVVKHGIFGYSASEGTPAYKEAILRWFRDRHGWEIDPKAIMFVNGTVEAIGIAIEAYTERGDGVMITRPVYGPFASLIEIHERTIVNSQLINNNGYYTMDFEDIERKIVESKVKMFLLCSPHNPTGRVWSKEELEKLSDICVRNNVILLADEVHCDIVRKNITFVSAGKVCNPDNTIVMNAINKTFNCAGLQCTHAIVHNSELLKKYKDTLGWRLPNPFAIAATIAAYTQGDEWLEQLLDYLDKTYDWVLKFLQEKMPKVKTYRAEGTYVLWMDFSEYGITPEEINERICKRANVILESGDFFDPENGGMYQRICLPSPRSMIMEAFERIEKEFQDIR